jgi:hypothetical protein
MKNVLDRKKDKVKKKKKLKVVGTYVNKGILKKN